MHRPLLTATVLVCLTGCATAEGVARPDDSAATPSETPLEDEQTHAAAAPDASPEPMAFETYQLVLLRSDETWKADPGVDLAALQKAHLAHLTAMAEAGHIVAAGPFGDQDDKSLRGLCLYRVGSVEEARALAEADPMVQAGCLRVEVMSWYTEAGYVVFPKAPPRAPSPAP